MATNKVGLTKLNLKKNTNVVPIEWNDQKIEVREYLPIQEKLDLIGRIVNLSLDDNNFANPMRIDIFTTLEIMYAYTNINFTDKQKEDFLGLYDLLVSSGLYDKVLEVVKGEEYKGDYWYITDAVDSVIQEVYKYKDSVLGILQAVNEDYKNLDLDATKIEEKLANKENLELLHNVMEKMG